MPLTTYAPFHREEPARAVTELRPPARAESPRAIPAPAGRRKERHPIGLLIVVGVHALLAAVLLSAGIRTGKPPPSRAAVKMLAPPPPVLRQALDLPEPPKSVLRVAVAPIPDVVVDRPETITVARQEAPAAPPPAPAAPPARDTNAVRGSIGSPGRPTRIDAGAEQCRPVYPHSAQREQVTGITKLRFSVDAAGHVASVEILQSSGPLRENRLLDKAAIEALSQCPVQVGTDDLGRPIGGTADVNYKWSID